MPPDATDGTRTTLAPDDAFAALGNETRMQILRTLGAADGPLGFSALRDRVGMRDSGQFNYHLDKLEGHFVHKTADGYALRPPGRRVIQTVLSGAVTEDAVVLPTVVDVPCPLCDAPTMIAFAHDWLNHYCTECDGYYGPTTPPAEDRQRDDGADERATYGFLGGILFPPAGLQGRTPDELFQAAVTRFLLEMLSVANRVCPRCSARLDHAWSVCTAHDHAWSVCTAHDHADGVCPDCGNRHALILDTACTNCLYDQQVPVGLLLLSDSDLLTFLLAHGINPTSPAAHAAHTAALVDYDEELLSTDPLEARLTYRLEGETLALIIDDDLSILDATTGHETGTE